MDKNHFYRVNPHKVLAEAIFHEDKESWFLTFFKELCNDDPEAASIPLAKEMILEAYSFRAKRSFAGKVSAEKRGNQPPKQRTYVKHMSTDDEQALNMDRTNSSSSNNSSTETEAEEVKKDMPDSKKPNRVPRKKKLNDEEMMNEIRSNPIYENIDIDREMEKMKIWCLKKGKQPTITRFVNWLNNVDVPLMAAIPEKPISYRERVNQAAVDGFLKGEY